MLIFFYGSDTYRLKQAKDDIVQRYKAKYKSAVNLFYFDFSETTDVALCNDALRTSSFFDEHKLIICKGVFNKKQSAENLSEIIKDQGVVDDSNTTLLVVENLSEKSMALVNQDLLKKLSGKSNIVKIFEPLNGAELLNWVKKEFEAGGCSVCNDVAKRLIDTIGNDSWALINEINKLSAYKRGDITDKEINLLVSSKTDLNIFNLTDAMALKDRNRFIGLLYHELKTGRDPYYILTMSIYQFRNLIIVKDLQRQKYSESEIAKKGHLHPFVVKKTLKSPFRLEELIPIYNSLLGFDTGFKMGTTNLEDSLYQIIFT